LAGCGMEIEWPTQACTAREGVRTNREWMKRLGLARAGFWGLALLVALVVWLVRR